MLQYIATQEDDILGFCDIDGQDAGYVLIQNLIELLSPLAKQAQS